ncbi:MAG TPA: SDR family oxidoreductase [Candidatus Nitrosocosmicus sp.]|nr:SDR family oxidoreductase [Candidatus Nitrosocosmicus sp.]
MKKIVLITGCASGFGFLTALKFARNGFETFASVRNIKSEGVKELEKISKEENLALHIIEIDVTSDVSVKKGIDIIKKKTKRIDILVNNAGFGFLGPIEEFTIEEIKQQYETNIFGTLRMIKEVVPMMRKNKHGMIINLSSINGLVPFPLYGVYGSSKFAIESLTETIRFELSHFNIKVTMIEPGSFLSKFAKHINHPKGMLKTDSPYKKLTGRFFKKYHSAHDKAKENKVSDNLLHPQKVADLIFKVSQKENPKVRYRIGLDAHMYFILKKILPHSIWEWLLHKAYKW